MPLEIVSSIYGGRGLKQSGELSDASNGSAYFGNDETGEEFLAVWGSRKGARFRSRIRQEGMGVKIKLEHPPARLIVASYHSQGV